MAGIFAGLTRGVPGLGRREMTAPDTCFEQEKTLRSSASLNYSSLGRKRFFLGLIDAPIDRDKQTNERYAQGGHMVGVVDDRHVMTVAGSRTGKGRAGLIPNMLLYDGSVLAIDPKGELALTTAEARAKKQRVCVVDPFNTTNSALPKEYYAGFNPVAFMREETAIEDAVLITDALVMPGGSDPHWDESAKTLIEGVVLEVFTAERFKGKSNLVTMRDLIAEGDKSVDAEELFGPEKEGATQMDVLAHFMQESKWSAVRRAGTDFFERPERERDSVLSTARRHLRALAFPEIEASLQGEGFDLSSLKTAQMTVYLCLPGRHMGTCGRWLRLFINLALQAMERTKGPPVDDVPVLFVMDEFASLGHMRQIEDAAGQIAGYGVKLWPVLQDLGQLKALYKERWETFMGNAGVLQFFGNNDLTTLEWISKRLGNTTVEQLSASQVTPGASEAGARGESYAPHTVPVLEPNEVALIFGREDPQLRQLIIQPGFAPMILQRAYWDKHEAFEGMRPSPR